MGKFLKNSEGKLVTIDGGLVLERTLDRKPKDCDMCGFSKWAKGDKVFIIQGGTGNNGGNTAAPNLLAGGGAFGGGMEWVCPDCALKRGLPVEFYHKNFFSPGNAQARLHASEQAKLARQKQQQANEGLPLGIDKLLDLTQSLCR